MHAKPDLKKEGGIDTDDFNRRLRLCIDQGFRGVYSFTYLGEGSLGRIWLSFARMPNERSGWRNKAFPKAGNEARQTAGFPSQACVKLPGYRVRN
ncbi:hypothetical protein LJK88_18320 [Paenibacillus sp. P26]|nr:hypothetical protein LJK88_18320 [Paenibacillus sp. P26]